MSTSEHKINLNYIYYNYFAIAGHLISAIAMMSLISGKNSLIIPYTESYLEWNNVRSNVSCPIGSRNFNTSDGKFCISTVTKPVSCDSDGDCYGVDLAWLIISFHLLSFVFQSTAALTNFTGPICGYKYNDMIQSGKNPLRFFEYSFSASIMLIAIAILNGVTDINLITSIAVLTSSCQLCGAAVEFIDNVRIKWLLHLTAWLQFCWAYGIIGHAFFKSISAAEDGSGTKPPTFVYIIVVLLFLLYSSFGFVQFYELMFTNAFIREKCCNNKNTINPYYKEISYVLLSLTAKLLLGWMIFANVLILG